MLDSLGSWATTKRSLGDRPVRLPVRTTSAPLAANIPSPRRIAISLRRAGLRFQWIFAKLRRPRDANAWAEGADVLMDRQDLRLFSGGRGSCRAGFRRLCG